MKILLRTPIDQVTGYGRDGIGLAQALLDRGHDVRLSPTSVGVPIPRDIAGLLTYDLDGPFDVAIHHLEPATVNLSKSEADMARINIFWSMWEWESIDPSVIDWATTFEQRIQHFDHVVAYDSQSLNAFAPYTNAETHVVQGGYTSEFWPLVSRTINSNEKPFVFGMNGKLTVRKGVYTAYMAFNRFKEKYPDANAELVLHSSAQVFPQGMPLSEGVTVIEKRWTQDQVKEFYSSIDCFLAPSWGEGKNLPPMEALSCGVPVILSDIPAHKAWANSSIATFVATTDKFCIPGHKGAYVDPEDLADLMYEHYTNRFQNLSKAMSGSRTVASSMDWFRCIERLGLNCKLPL